MFKALNAIVVGYGYCSYFKPPQGLQVHFIDSVGHALPTEQVLFMLAEQHAGDSAEGQDTIKLVYGDESIPSLFETSRISQKQLPGQPGAV